MKNLFLLTPTARKDISIFYLVTYLPEERNKHINIRHTFTLLKYQEYVTSIYKKKKKSDTRNSKYGISINTVNPLAAASLHNI
jgi:hypothetical protein